MIIKECKSLYPLVLNGDIEASYDGFVVLKKYEREDNEIILSKVYQYKIIYYIQWL